MSERQRDGQPADVRRLLVSCEHGGNDVPSAYLPHFATHGALLQSHRGWDPGALELAQQMSEALDAPLFASRTTRLLIDLNRSIGHKRLYSEATRGLPAVMRRAIVQAHYLPHRQAVISSVKDMVEKGLRVMHVASHSFTPELGGVTREADVAWLYDPKRPGEREFAAAWMKALNRRMPGLRLRRNYPYQGKEDGLISSLRRQLGDDQYVGVELEVNQKFALGSEPGWMALREAITRSLTEVLR